MATTSPNDIQAQELKLVTMTNLLNATMYSTFARTSPWNSQMIMSGEWTDGVGDSGRIATFGATDPRPEWMNISLDSTSDQIPITVNRTGATTYSYSRFITRLASEKLDVLRMRQSWQAQQQAENIVKQLVRAVGNAWSRFYRQSYINIASYKLIPTKAGIVGLDVVSNDINSMPEVKPEAALNDDLMNQAWQLLINEGAGDSAAFMDQGSPVFLAYTSKDTVDFILRENQVIHKDWNFAEAAEGKEATLLRQLGVKWTYKGFTYVVDNMNPRYTFDDSKPTGQKWVEVPQYIPVETTVGTRYVPNPAYMNAPYEDTIIFVKDVYKSLVPRPVSAYGQAKWDPVTYAGELTWVNNKDNDANYMGTQGLFVATLSAAPMPVFPRHGVVIRHIRTTSGRNLVGADGQPIGSLVSTPSAVAGL
jgi:hypothetical protein|nr:MAG TPA: hypothetical protein [Caudoviricetes sp.]